jgi:hypothetical protein
MERLNLLRQSILEVYQEYADYLRGGNEPDVRYQLIIDDTNKHFQLVAVGWRGIHRIFYVLFQCDLIDNKIWIQADNTEEGLASFLEDKGILKSEMVLAYFPEFHRKYMAYAVR